MRTRNNVLVLDTETVGTFGKPLVHDIGWHIIDRNFEVLNVEHFLVEEFHNEQEWVLKASDFYRTKAEQYKEMRKTVQMLPWKEIMDIMLQVMRIYNVKTIAAYNLAFDYKALNYTTHFFDAKNEKFMKTIDKKSKLCIWNLACDTILDTEDYRNYATMKDFISEKGNYLTNAEACYSYLIGDEDFKEDHTALADVEIEVEILKHIIENCVGKIEYGLAYSCWRKVQK